MSLNIARQPLVSAFLILSALTAVAMWRLGVAEPTASVAPAALSANVLPDSFLLNFQCDYPIWGRFIGGFMLLCAGVIVGRMTVRYNLYSTGTCLAISLVGIMAVGYLRMATLLPDLLVLLLLALSCKNYCRGFSSSYGFDGLFRGSFFLGLIPFFEVAAAPLLLLLLLVVIVYRRTFRELGVALAGLLLPTFVVCYLNWAFGGKFSAPVVALVESVDVSRFFDFFWLQPVPVLVLTGCIAFVGVAGILFFLTNMYAVGNKPRHILILHACLLLLCMAQLSMPNASEGTALLMVVPAAVLLPTMVVRLHRLFATGFYLLLIAGSLCLLFLQ